MICSWTLILLILPVLMVGCVPVVPPSPATATHTGAEATAILPPTQTEDAGWEVILQVDVGHPTIAAEFLDEAFGVTVGDSSELDYTTDGGQTWSRAADNTAQSRAGLDIVDERVIWLVGAGGRVWTSTDGGRNWQAVSRLPYSGHVEFISFLDAHTGWAASAESKQLWATGDRGQTWEEIAVPKDAGDLVAIVLRTASDGYLLDSAGVLHITQDGGQSWSSQTVGLDLDNESLTMTIPILTPSVAVRFWDADCGMVVLGLSGGGKSEVRAARTTDGGRTWERESVPVSIGQFYLAHDGITLTVADLIDSGRITVLRAARVACVGSPDNGG